MIFLFKKKRFSEEDLRVELQNMKPGEGVIRAEVGMAFKNIKLKIGKK